MEKKNLLTYEGLKRLEDELQDLKVVKRKEVAQKIKEAREQGDLSENAEVVVEDEVDLDKINVGCKVRLLDCEFDEELEYKIVGSTEANSLKGKISNESPLGKAIIGHKVGETVTVETEAGELDYMILEIQRSGQE